MTNKFQIGDIALYNDPLFDDSKCFISSYFIVSDIVDGMYYYMLPLTNDDYSNDIESYLVTWVDDSWKWEKAS
jgi:hypothetical protein